MHVLSCTDYPRFRHIAHLAHLNVLFYCCCSSLYERCASLCRCCLSVYLCLTFSCSQLFDFMCLLNDRLRFFKGGCLKKSKLRQVRKAHFALHNNFRQSRVCNLCGFLLYVEAAVMVNVSLIPRR